jgi:hypothetical protein
MHHGGQGEAQQEAGRQSETDEESRGDVCVAVVRKTVGTEKSRLGRGLKTQVGQCRAQSRHRKA